MNTGTLIGWGIATFIWCLFMGVTAISIGFGAMFPPMNLIAQPFVCPNGQVTYEETTSNPLPGTTYTQIYWYCVDARSGTKTDLDIFPMSLYSGILYGLLLFGVIVAVLWVLYKRRNAAQRSTGAHTVLHADAPFEPARGPTRASAADDRRARELAEQKGQAAHANLERMKELKELHETKMISDEEYAQKRAEILKEL